MRGSSLSSPSEGSSSGRARRPLAKLGRRVIIHAPKEVDTASSPVTPSPASAADSRPPDIPRPPSSTSISSKTSSTESLLLPAYDSATGSTRTSEDGVPASVRAEPQLPSPRSLSALAQRAFPRPQSRGSSSRLSQRSIQEESEDDDDVTAAGPDGGSSFAAAAAPAAGPAPQARRKSSRISLGSGRGGAPSTAVTADAAPGRQSLSRPRSVVAVAATGNDPDARSALQQTKG
ncbi:hypothetical protein HK405_015237 [Cladochytrium tenue]|nr:hypothetical protein HK405_015237 [Cladochytrium tenue]